MKLFISYAHKDNNLVYPVVEELDKHYNCWIDKDIVVGSNWRNSINTAISKSKVVLYFVSNNSINSIECRKELELAFKLHKRVIPIILEELVITEDVKDLVKQINELQWIYLDDIYKLFNVLRNKPLTIIELTILFNSLLLLVILYLALT